jgi:hypothetical protein
MPEAAPDTATAFAKTRPAAATAFAKTRPTAYTAFAKTRPTAYTAFAKTRPAAYTVSRKHQGAEHGFRESSQGARSDSREPGFSRNLFHPQVHLRESHGLRPHACAFAKTAPPGHSAMFSRNLFHPHVIFAKPEPPSPWRFRESGPRAWAPRTRARFCTAAGVAFRGCRCILVACIHQETLPNAGPADRALRSACCSGSCWPVRRTRHRQP